MNVQLEFIKQITSEISLQQCNEIPVIVLNHQLGKAVISLQGAHLLSWQPTSTQQEVFWLSEIEPFKLGSAIRGGVPICYPWFGPSKSPSHGYARISLWQLSDFEISDQNARLVFSLFSDDDITEAKITMDFAEQCKLTFTHYGTEPAQAVLHSYFNIGDINTLSVAGFPTTCLNELTNQQETVPSPRLVAENVDCIYRVEKQAENTIIDPTFNRNIHLTHQNASNIVFWNPWHKPTSAMTEEGYKTMVCVETGRVDDLLLQGESVSVLIEPK